MGMSEKSKIIVGTLLWSFRLMLSQAGNPYEKFVKTGTEGFLEPRKSFKTWSETVVGKCREWTEEQVETAAVLCLVYGKFIEVC